MKTLAKNGYDSEGCEVSDLVDSVVCGRSSRRGLLGVVALAIVSGCAARVKSVVGEKRSSDEICRPDGELEVPLDAIAQDLPLESKKILAQFKEDEAKADGMVEEAFVISKRYENLDTVQRMINLRYDAYMEFRNRATYDAYFSELSMIIEMVGELDEAIQKLAEVGYLYKVMAAGLLRLSAPNGDAGFVRLFKRARMKKLCDLRRKASEVHVISGGINVSYSQLEAMVPDGTSYIPEVMYED